MKEKYIADILQILEPLSESALKYIFTLLSNLFGSH